LTAGQDRDRSAIGDKYKWNLTDLYPDLAAWRAAKEAIARELPRLRTYQGKLGSSAQLLAEALEDTSRLDKEIARLSVYAGMLADQDTREAGPQGMQQEMQQLAADFKVQVAYVEPELLHVGVDTLEQFIASEPRLAIYSFYLHDIARRAAHTLSDAEEKILADAMPLAASGHNVYNILANADFPYPTITLSDGRTAKVDPSGYAELRTLPNRHDREQAMSTFFQALGTFSRTFGTMMNANVQRVAFYAKTRKYSSHLESALDGPNIPVSVYTRLIDGINHWLPSFHRYLKLRRRMMRISDHLRYHDLYAPLVAEVELTFTPEEAQQQILDALRPLRRRISATWSALVQRALIRCFPSAGSWVRVFRMARADVHPHMPLNYLWCSNTSARQLARARPQMHSYYLNTSRRMRSRTIQLCRVEVASTFNEALLIDRVLRDTKDVATRLLAARQPREYQATVFRQTQFAEFELRMHQTPSAASRLPVRRSAGSISTSPASIDGHADGIALSTTTSATMELHPALLRRVLMCFATRRRSPPRSPSEKVAAGDEEARKRYLTFLGSGTSKYPIELLKNAGVDMTTDEPLDFTMRKMIRVMDEIEQVLAKR
jgi:oligoendopeptidase F